MATSAFKTSTRRSSLAPGDAGSSNRTGSHRRSRSLSRYSGRFPPPPPDASDDSTTPRGKFVNKTRGSGFPEISLDDLADEFFGSKELEVEDGEVRSGSVQSGRSNLRSDEERFRMETESSRRRGRSVSKKGGSSGGDGSRQQRRSLSVARDRRDVDFEDEKNLYNGEVIHHDRFGREGKIQNGNNRSSRHQRSVSVARYRCSDIENDSDKFSESGKLRSFDNGNLQKYAARKQVNSTHALRRSISQKDLLQSLDNYSSHSSTLTDDEIRDVHSNKSESEKTIRAVYSLEKTEHPTGDGDGRGLYETMRNEVRHAVQEIRTEFEKVLVKKEPTVLANGDSNLSKGSNAINVISEIRRSYTNELEQSEKRKQDLLAELAAEEQRGHELTNIVRELLPAPKQAAVAERPSRPRRRSNDRTRISKHLTEEAERYFEGFLSNVEDTDLSSFDGERSDTSSTLGGTAKRGEPPIVHTAISEVHEILATLNDETDGVLLPWLEWETSNDVTPSPCKSKTGVPWTAAQDTNGASDNSIHPGSSLGSWSPGGNDSSCAVSSQAMGNTFEQVVDSCLSAPPASEKTATSSFDMDEYEGLQRSEHLLFEMLKQRHRIQSGSLILCGRAPSF